MQDVIDKCYLYENIRSQKLNSKRLNSLKEGVVDVDQVGTYALEWRIKEKEKKIQESFYDSIDSSSIYCKLCINL